MHSASEYGYREAVIKRINIQTRESTQPEILTQSVADRCTECGPTLARSGSSHPATTSSSAVKATSRNERRLTCPCVRARSFHARPTCGGSPPTLSAAAAASSSAVVAAAVVAAATAADSGRRRPFPTVAWLHISEFFCKVAKGQFYFFSSNVEIYIIMVSFQGGCGKRNSHSITVPNYRHHIHNP